MKWRKGIYIVPLLSTNGQIHCPPTKQETPNVLELRKAHKGEKGIHKRITPTLVDKDTKKALRTKERHSWENIKQMY